MRIPFGFCVLIISASACCGQEQRVRIEDLAWLAGCWERSGAGWSSTEQWMKPAGATMLGMSRTVAGDKTVEYEFIMISQDEAGMLYYTAHPSGQESATFPLLTCDERSAVFENRAHDFPQRVIYTLADNGVLHARIEGTKGSEPRGIDFLMTRRPCDE